MEAPRKGEGSLLSHRWITRASQVALKSALARGATTQADQLKLNIRDLAMRLPLEQQECAGGPEKAKTTPMSIASSVVANGGVLPSVHSCYGTNGIRREKTGVQPPLTFNNVPPKATSLLLLTEMENNSLVMWQVLTVNNTSPSWKELLPQMRDTSGTIVNSNTFGGQSYAGPCPQEGTIGAYRFELFALSGATTTAFGTQAREIRANIRPFVVSYAALDVKALGGPTAKMDQTAQGVTPSACPTISAPNGSGWLVERNYPVPFEGGWLALSMNSNKIPDRIQIFDANNPKSLIFSSRSVLDKDTTSCDTCIYRDGDFSWSIAASFFKPPGLTLLKIVIDCEPSNGTTLWNYSLSCSLLSTPPPGYPAMPTVTPTPRPTNTPLPRPTSTPTKTPTPRPSMTPTATPTPSPSPTPRRIPRNFDVTPKSSLTANTRLVLDFASLEPNKSTNVLVQFVDVAGNVHKCKGGMQFKMPASGAITLAATLPPEIVNFSEVLLSATMPNWAASQLSTIATTSKLPATAAQVRAVCDAVLKASVISTSSKAAPGGKP